MSPEISVLVPTYRRPDMLERLLASLEDQTLDPERLEVVVVDDHSEDRTEQVLARAAERSGNVRPFTQDRNRGPAAARNRAVKEARAPLVLFCDDDIVVPTSLVEGHLRAHAEHADPQLGVLGRVDWHPDLRVTAFMRWVDRSGLQFAYDTWLRAGAVDPPYAAFYTANLSLPRKLVVDAGGFDERFPYPAYEDMELAWRLTERGFRLRYEPELLVYHIRAIDLPTFRRRMAMVAESAALLRRVRPEFRVDEDAPLAGRVRRRDRLALRLLAPLARLLGRERLLERHFRAEIAAAYEQGRRRALEEVSAD